MELKSSLMHLKLLKIMVMRKKKLKSNVLVLQDTELLLNQPITSLQKKHLKLLLIDVLLLLKHLKETVHF